MEVAGRERLSAEGFEVTIRVVNKPAWTTDWLSEETREKLRAYGIAPTLKLTFEHLHPLSRPKQDEIACPFCASKNTTLTSQFGSTACKALYFCDVCHQPFELFKCH